MAEITQTLTVAQTGVAGPAGPTGPQGATIHWGSGVPVAGLGNDGDQYLDYDSADLYGKTAGSWALLRNLRGPQGFKGDQGDQGIQGIQGIQGVEGLGIYAGNGAPDAGTGRDGELYLELDSPGKNLHQKSAGSWAVIGTMAGPKGDTGRGISSTQVLADGTLRITYDDASTEDAGPFPVTGLARHVATLSNPGAGSAEYWAKIATFNMPAASNGGGMLLLAINTTGSSIRGQVLLAVCATQQADPDTLVGDSGVAILANAGPVFADDAFKLVGSGYGQPVELWARKATDYFGATVHELTAGFFGGASVTYNDGATWQATEPSAAYVLQSAGLATGDNARIYHQGFKPSAADVGAVPAGGTLSLSGNASASASFDADGNMSLNVTVSYASSAGSAGSASSAGNADTVDNLHAASFVRADADDDVNGHTEWQDSKETRWGNDADARMMHNGSHAYLSIHTGDLYMRQGTTTRYLFDVSSGNLHADGHVYWQSASVGSDPMLKTNVRRITNPIRRLFKLTGYFFDWIDSGRGAGGLMSPDMRKALPRTVYKSRLKKDGKRYDQADYNAATGLLVEVCKDQEVRLSENAASLKEQGKTIRALQRMVEKLQRQNQKKG